MGGRMTERPRIPRIEDITLSPQEAALLHLYDKMAALEKRVHLLEDIAQREILMRERTLRGQRSQIGNLRAQIAQLKRGQS